MNILNSQYLLYVTIGFFAVRQLRNIFYILYIWQLKEYRLDRMLIHLKSQAGKNWMLGKLSILKWMVLVGLIVFPQFQKEIALLAIVYFVEFLLILSEWKSSIKRPQFTLKIILICILVTLISISTVFIQLPFSIKLLSIDKFTPILIGLCMLLFTVPAAIFKRIIIWRAQKKLKTLPNLIRIGITGSFGKSSTKEFLAQILSQKYSVVKTPNNINTDIGIAQTILKNITPKTQIFIAEMGAYKKGEIKKSTNIVAPSIGIITGINEQHVELFGSLTNTRTAKYELIAGLLEPSVAIFNADNEFSRLMAKQTKNKEVILVGSSRYADIKIANFSAHGTSQTFTLEFDKHKMTFTTPIIAKHMIMNISLAVAAGLQLKVPLVAIKEAVGCLTSLENTLYKAGTSQGALLFDDTYNANPHGVKAGVSFLTQFPGKKYIVTTPLIELGKSSLKIHSDVVRFALSYCDRVFLTNRQHDRELMAIATKIGKQDNLVFADQNKIAVWLKKNLGADDAVVFSGKESARVLHQLIEKTN